MPPAERRTRGSGPAGAVISKRDVARPASWKGCGQPFAAASGTSSPPAGPRFQARPRLSTASQSAPVTTPTVRHAAASMKTATDPLGELRLRAADAVGRATAAADLLPGDARALPITPPYGAFGYESRTQPKGCMRDREPIAGAVVFGQGQPRLSTTGVTSRREHDRAGKARRLQSHARRSHGPLAGLRSRSLGGRVPPYWRPADQVTTAGLRSPLLPSLRHAGGTDRVIFPANMIADDKDEVHDPHHRLPRDPSSWA